MANKFTIKSQDYNTRYMYLTCEQTQDIVNNQSIIKWTLTVTGGYTSYYSTGATTVTIGGNQVYYAPRKGYNTQEFPAARGSVSGTVTIPHNADGTKSVSVSLTTAIYTNSLETSSGTWALDAIPRGVVITKAPNFNDEQNPIIEYINYSGGNINTLQACISLTGATDDIKYRDISKSGNSYTFNLTEEERNLLRNATLNGSDNRQVSFFIKTVIGSNTFYNAADRKLTIINAAPTLSPIVEDKSTLATALTGNAATMIRGYNSIFCSAGATAKKGATIKSYSIINGSKSLSSATGYFDYSENNTFIFKVTDNRGLSASKTITLPMIEYVKLTADLAAAIELSGEETSKITLKISGNFFNNSFGAKKNTLQFKYAIKVNNGEYSNWTAISAAPTHSGDYYEAITEINNLSYINSYTVKVMATDLIYYGGVVSNEIVLKTIPVFDWSGSDFNFNVPVTINGSATVSGGVNVGGKATFNGGVKIGATELDYIVEQGTNNGWTYRKWNSGVAECWKILTHTTAATTQWGVLWKGDSFAARQNYPFNFKDKPVENVSLQAGNIGGFVLPADGGEGVNGAAATARYTVCRPASTTSNTYYFSFYVVGKWK